MKHYLFDQFVATRLFRAASYSPDGETIAYIDNTTGQFNLWTIPSGGGIPRQLTTFTDHSVRDIHWSPDGSQIVFTADESSTELTHIYIIDAAGSWAEKLTEGGEHIRYTVSGWSPDGDSLLYTTNDANPGEMDAVLHNLKSGESNRLMTGAQNYAGNISPDEKYITVCQVYGNTAQNIFVVEVESGEAMLATPHEGEVIFQPMRWSPDSSGFYFVSNFEREFTGVGFYTLETGKWEWVFTPDHDIEDFSMSEDGKTLIFAVNENGATKLYGRNTETGDAVNLPDLPIGVAGSINLAPDASKAVLLYASSAEATNLYEIDLSNGEMTPLGQSMLGGINLDDMVIPELIEYKTFDGKMIPAWLYKPETEGDTFPIVLSIHGGPEAQERPTYNYNGLYQYLLNRGIGVLAPNVRGSTGYGISYQRLIHRDWGGAELKDFEHAFKYMHSLDWVDNDRIAVYGGSFGGFATLSIVSRLPDLPSVAVDIVGPGNLITFLNSVPPHWKPLMKTWLGDVDEDYDFLIERSPITYVDNIKVPMLIIQGANDPRVVKAESDQMVERIRENGGDVEYYVDPEEGHGAQRRENMVKWMRMIAEYLEEHLVIEKMPEPA